MDSVLKKGKLDRINWIIRIERPSAGKEAQGTRLKGWETIRKEGEKMGKERPSAGGGWRQGSYKARS